MSCATLSMLSASASGVDGRRGPLVRAAINERVSGDPNIWPVRSLARRLGKTIGPCLSIGCGLGGLERSLIEERISNDITGIDVSETVLAEARKAGGDMPIRYIAADAREFLRGKTYDAIFFHQSLHHFDRLDALMDLVAGALRPGGFLWFDEYIGPSRTEWKYYTDLGIAGAIPRRGAA